MNFLSIVRVAALILAVVMPPAMAAPAGEVDTNVVYGMVSGTALLLDVYKPVQSNNVGISSYRAAGGIRRPATTPRH